MARVKTNRPQYIVDQDNKTVVVEATAGSGVNESTINEIVENSLETYAPGTELGYAERTTPFTTTDNATLNTRISGLTVTVLGTGRRVDIEFYCPGVWHSTANADVRFYIVRDDLAFQASDSQVISKFSPSTTSGPEALLKRSIVIPDGVTRVYKVGMLIGVAGTGTANGDPLSPMYLSAVSR